MDILLPLSAAQELILADLYNRPEKSQAYNLADYVEFVGPIDQDCLCRAIRHVVHRCASLRLKLIEVDGELKQIVRPQMDVPIISVDVSDNLDAHTAAFEWMESQRSKCFEPVSDQLCRFALITLTPGRCYWYSQFHHLIIDGVGLKLFKDRVAETYTSLCSECDPDISDDTRNFGNYLAYYSGYRQSPTYRSDLDFWSSTAAVPTTLVARQNANTPTRHPLQSGIIRLSSELLGELTALAASSNLRVAQLLIAAVAIYLHRILQQGDISVQIPTHGRVEPWMASLVGACVNVLPVSIHIDGEISTADCLNSVSKQITNALSHRRLKRAEIQHAQLNKFKGLHHCAVSINAMPYSTSMQFGDVIGTPRLLPPPDIDDVSFFLFMGATGNVSIRIDGDPLNYKHWELDAHLANYHELLRAIVLNPNVVVSKLRLLANNDVAATLANSLPPQSSEDLQLHARFAKSMLARPNAITYVERNAQATLGQLDQLSDSVARSLTGRLQRQPHLVGVRTASMINTQIAVLGVLKAGATCMMLDEVTIVKLSNDGQHLLDAIVTDVPDDSRLRDIADAVVQTDMEQVPTTKLASLSDSPFCAAVLKVNDNALEAEHYSHVHVTAQAAAASKHFALVSTDRIAFYSASTIHSQLSEIALLWSCGAICIEVDNNADPVQQLRYLAQHQVTVVSLSTSLWCRWIRACLEHRAQLPDSLRLVLIAGEPLPRNAMALWQSQLNSKCSQLNYCYRDPNTGAYLSAQRVDDSACDDECAIGKPFTASSIQIVDEQGQCLPPAVVGELCIGSSESFSLQNDFENGRNDESLKALLRTGAKARYHSNGNIEYLGFESLRATAEGATVATQRVEHLINQHFGIIQCAVVAHFKNLRSHIVAYFVRDPRNDFTLADLRDFVAARVSYFMIPAHFVEVSEFPLNDSGAIDKQTLSLRQLPNLNVAEYVEPRDALEATLVRIWIETLQVDRLGVFDNLFDLGVDSISATYALARIEEELQIEVSLAVLSQADTVAALAERLQLSQREMPPQFL